MHMLPVAKQIVYNRFVSIVLNMSNKITWIADYWVNTGYIRVL